MNRRLVDQLSDRHYAPTPKARENLLAEGFEEGRILVTGNTGIDALVHVTRRLEREPDLRRRALALLPTLDPERRLVLVTGHRRESFGAGLRGICEALARLASRADVEVVYPVHPNPNVCRPVRALLGDRPRIHLTRPLDYLPFVHLMTRAHLIVTDSGGIQEEAPALGKPVLVTRDVTERPEAVDAGTALLVGTDPERILAHAERLLDDRASYDAMSRIHSPYGDGRASDRIAKALAVA